MRGSLNCLPVRQILLNLALNPAQAIPAVGVLSIRVPTADCDLRIRVVNAGELLPETQLRHLLEPFPVDGSAQLGLGLWMTDKTVRQLDSRIQVVSTPEQTSFEVFLPLGASA